MKRCAAIVAAAALVMSMAALLVGCESQQFEPTAKSPQLTGANLVKEGTLTVGVDTSNPPLAGQSTKIIGIDADVAAALADELGLTLELVDVGGDAQNAIKSKKVDIVMGIESSDSAAEKTTAAGDGTQDANAADADNAGHDAAAGSQDGEKSGSAEAKTADSVDSAAKSTSDLWKSESYLPTAVALFSSSPSTAVPKKDSSTKIGVQASSASSWSVTSLFGSSAASIETDLSNAFSHLQSGSVQYVAADAVIGSYAASTSGVEAYIIALLQKPTGYCIGCASANTALSKAIATALSTVKGNGIIDIVQNKWLGTSLDLAGKTVITEETASPAASPAATQ